jgi:hypothetical protein
LADLLLITPPFTQLNTPYPATAYLKGFLNTQALTSVQVDLGIEVILRLFTRARLADMFAQAEADGRLDSPNLRRIYALRQAYLQTVEPVIAFLQGKQPTLARAICSENFLPQAGRFAALADLEWAFGSMGLQDRAKHLATLYLEDLSDFIVAGIDAHFGFSRYAERLGRSANRFDELYATLLGPPTYVDQLTLEILAERLATTKPRLVCFSVPFPGNLYSAFRCAQFIQREHPGVQVAMGGGFANTELRSLSDPRVFDFFDFITLDDGELPIELLAQQVLAPSATAPHAPAFKRTFRRVDGQVVYQDDSPRPDYPQHAVGTPDYAGLPLDQYLSVIEVANPMHSLWSDGRWNKLTMAHGCYWGKCTFCDTSLDYIRRYEPLAARLLVDRMEALIAQTGEQGFHFVDEAAPPALMRALALEIIRRGLTVTWWTNIRFEKSFTRDLCLLLSASGCVAVSGGLEVASDRLLALIDKGVTVAQVAQVTRFFTESGILVHAYLMYGYPTQTIQETVDSLEMVRQLFAAGVLQSGFWHQFALTAHSPIGLAPEAFGLVPDHQPIAFAHNDVAFTDETGIDHSQFGLGLKQSLFNFMHGVGLDLDLQEWFDLRIPATTVDPDYIADCLAADPYPFPKPSAKVIWLGQASTSLTARAGQVELTLHDKREAVTISLPMAQGEWLIDRLEQLAFPQTEPQGFAQLRAAYEQQWADFETFWRSEALETVREYGLLVW